MTPARPEEACPLPERRQGGARATVVTVLLCAHCSLTALAAIAALGLAFVPPAVGWTAKWVVLPLGLLGLVGFLFFGGRLVDRLRA